MRTILALPLVLLALLIGCDSGGPTEPAPPPHPTMNGSWQGTAGGMIVNLTLSESASTISGAGSMVFGNESIAVNTTGVRTHPNVTLTLRATGYQDSNFSGAFTGDNAVAGHLTGSGFNNVAITLRRQ
jgi:hypothetical protein